jgi:hypothetical protein
METIPMENPPVSEDGLLLDPKVLEKFNFKKYNPHAIEFGTTQFPLNVYGG